MTSRILIVNDGAATRGGGLSVRFRRRNAVARTLPLAALAFDATHPSGIAIPGFGDALPDAVLVRAVGAGSFEAVTRRLGILHALAQLGVPVWNSAAAIERCVDKSMTSFLLSRAGLLTPPTFAVEGRAAAEAVARRELAAGPLVLKPLFGAQGRGIRLVRCLADLPAADAVGQVFYLQRYVERRGPPFRDVRAFVCAGRVVAMMSRCGADWITNVTRGAAPEPLSGGLDRAALADLAVAAAAAVGTDFAGVDLVEGADGALKVLEVNSMPAWSGLQSVAAVDIADALVEALLARLAERRAAASLPRPARLASPANRS